jgi:hypothetical protein
VRNPHTVINPSYTRKISLTMLTGKGTARTWCSCERLAHVRFQETACVLVSSTYKVEKQRRCALSTLHQLHCYILPAKSHQTRQPSLSRPAGLNNHAREC